MPLTGPRGVFLTQIMPEITPPTLPLRDIIAPLEQGWWPPAPGWWGLAIVALFLMAWLVRALVKYFTYEYSAIRKRALQELTALQQQQGLSDAQFAEQVSALLKRVALLRYTAQQPAQLSAQAWLAFLDQTSPTRAFSQSGGGALLAAQYEAAPSIDRKRLLDAAHTWVKAI